MENPEIKDTTGQKIFREIKSKAPFFLPGWQPDETDPGLALARIFTDMYMSLIDRLNLAPLMHYISFLETIDTRLLPPQPAEAPVVFVPADGTTEDIPVPVSTKVAGKDREGESVVFETEKTFVVTPSKLKAIFSFIPGTDRIYEHSGLIDGQKSVSIFTGTDLQSHILYIGEKDLLNIKSARILLRITGKGVDKLAETGYVQWEYIAEGDEESGEIKKLFPKKEGGRIILEKEDNSPIKETEIKGIKSRWIYCKWVGKKNLAVQIEIESIKLSVEPVTEEAGTGMITPYGIGGVLTENIPGMGSYGMIYPDTGQDTSKGISPDHVFANDVPVNSQDFYPFGRKPKLYDTCYIASEEVFSKKGYQVVLNFDLDPGEGEDPELSWEYWDGESWSSLGIKENLTTKSSSETKIELPSDISKTTINGKEAYWIRIRLVGGDYGREYTITDNEVVEGEYCPPRIKNLKLRYLSDSKEEEPEYLLTENNIQIVPKKAPFKPFEFLTDKDPALYLCFSAPLNRGPYSLYFDIDRFYHYPDTEPPPSIKWQCYTSEGWKNLSVEDSTAGLTRAGTLLFYPEEETAPCRLFGIEDGYWIRAVIDETPWKLSELSEAKVSFPEFLPVMPILKASSLLRYIGMIKQLDRFRIGGGSPRDQDIRENCEEIPLFIKDMVKEDIKEVPPTVNALYLNATVVKQRESIEDENIGSGTGQKGQILKTASAPVIDETLWVNEFNSISERERAELKEIPDIVREEYDKDGNLTGFWVKWNPVENFIESGPEDRHYLIDRVTGEIRFGDGKHGMALPAGTDNVRISYKTGGGKKGNLPEGKIKELHSSIAFIDRVYNPVPAEGGCNTEDIDALIERGSIRIRHRNRAVSVKDYHQLAFEASRAVARVKVIPGLDDTLKPNTGHVTVVVVPHSEEEKPLATTVLKKEIKEYLSVRSSNLVKVHVIDPVYIKTDVLTELTVESIEMIPSVDYEVRQKLKAFLHPLTGGEDEKGWEFGSLPCLSDLYALLQDIQGVLFVNNISIVLTADGNTYTIDRGSAGLRLPEYTLIYAGEIDVKISSKSEAKP